MPTYLLVLPVQQLAESWASCISQAERPSPYSSRDGSLLRLVPANERLSQEQLQQQLVKLFCQQQHLVDDFTQHLPHTSKRKVPRHLAAWARGWCYLTASNSRQALRDANTALAYAPGSTASTASAETPAVTQHGISAFSKPQTTALTVAHPHIGPGTGSTDNSSSSQPPATTAADTTKTAADTTRMQQKPYPVTACTWVPALVLAAECHTALNNLSQAVVLLAKAAQQAPNDVASAARLTEITRQLSAEQGLAWRRGGLAGLLEQLQVEAEMKLPEVLRPRPKWYYYNKWMTQRIHTALLQLHLGCSLSGSSSGSEELEGLSSAQLLLAAEAAADTPAVAAAAAAAGFLGLSNDAAPREGHLEDWRRQQQAGQVPVLQLPQAVVDKLLSVDAGDLDLMIKHPTALQAQVYELLDVLESSGAAALEGHTIPELSWQEVQALAAAATGREGNQPLVGLPLGYTPPRKQPALPAGVAAAVPALVGAAAVDGLGSVLQLNSSDKPHESADPLADGSEQGSQTVGELVTSAMGCGSDGGLVVVDPDVYGWRRHGWRRAEYILGRGRV